MSDDHADTFAVSRVRRGTVHYFAYGLDLDAPLTGAPRAPALLRYHRLALVATRDLHAPALTVVPDPRHAVPGVVVRVSIDDLPRVAEAAAVAELHARERVVVWLSGDRVLLAQVHRTCVPVLDARPCALLEEQLRQLYARHGVETVALEAALAAWVGSPTT